MSNVISYYKLLSSKADPDIMNIPLTAIGLSSKSKYFLQRETKYEDGKQVPKFNTIGDIISYGKTPLMGLFSSHTVRYNEIREVMVDIEECLAKLGLKLSGTDFTVGDVKVERLGLVRDSGKLISKLKNKIQTLDDLVIYGAPKLARQLNENKLVTILEISQALEKYGLKLEGSPYRLNSERFFPLKEYSQYLSKERRKEIKKIKPVNIRRIYFTQPTVDLHSLPHDELLETSIEELPLSIHIKEAFDKNNIRTIGELTLSKESTIRKNLSSDQFRTVENVLASLKLSLADSKKKIVDGKVVRTKFIRLLPTAPKKVNIHTLPEIAQNKYLNTPIMEFGFSEYLLEPFKNQNQLLTIRDLTQNDIKSIVKIVGNQSIVASMRKALQEYGLDYKAQEKTLKVTKYVDEVKIKENNIPKEPSDEQKQDYLKMRLIDAGFTTNLIKEIENTGIKAETIADLVGHVRSDFTSHGMTNAQYVAMKKILEVYGYSIEIDTTNGRYKADKAAIQLTEEEANRLKAEKIETLGLYPSLIETLKASNITTIGDLTQNSKAEVKVIVNGNIYAYNTIKEQLTKLGLKLITADEKKKLLKQSENEDSSSVISYQMRQEKHKKLAINYLAHRQKGVKPRNQLLFDEDFNEHI